MKRIPLFLMLALGGADATAQEGLRDLIEVMESIQQPVRDFRCGFEGSIRVSPQPSPSGKPSDYTIVETFGGVFIRNHAGDLFTESLHRRSSQGGRIARDTLVVRAREGRAELLHRMDDQNIGQSTIDAPKRLANPSANVLGQIFLLDKLRMIADEAELEARVRDDEVEGRPAKLVEVSIKGVPGALASRYWIDLARTGHVVRADTIHQGGALASRLDVVLERFDVEDQEVWMPISGDLTTFLRAQGGQAGENGDSSPDPTGYGASDG